MTPMQDMQPLHYRIRWLVASLGIILCITFFPYLFGGKTFLPVDLIDTMMAPYNAEFGPPQAQNHYIYDGIAQTYPYKSLTKEAYERGKLAYWNPHILAGYPEYAESLANNFDIFNVLLLWLSPQDVIHWQTVIELFIAGVGILFLLRFFGVSPLVNLIFASAYMLNSMFITSAHYRCTIASFCWIPFTVLMLLRYFYYKKKENLLYAALFLALAFLGGNFQTSFFAAFVLIAIVFCYPSTESKYKVLNRIGVLFFIGITAFALSAIMWLPSLELLFQTLFRGGSLNSTNVFDEYTIAQRLLSIPLLAMFFFPGLTGNAQSYNLKKIAGVDIMNFNGAICFLPTLFALWGCYVFWKKKTVRPFIILSVLAITLPIATPLFSILYHRFFIVASFSFCVVGAVSFDSFMHNEEARNAFAGFFKWTKILLGLLIAALVGACAYIAFNYQSVFAKFTKYVAGMIPGSTFGMGNESWMYGRVAKTFHYYSFLSAGLWLPILSAVVIILSLGYYRKGKLSQRSTLWVVVLATIPELFIYTTSWLPSLDIHHFPIYPKNGITDYLRSDSSQGRYTTWRDPSKDPYVVPENCSNIYKIYDIHGYETCTNRAMIVFYKRHVRTDSLDFRLLGLANVKYIVTGQRTVTSFNLRRLYSADSMTIFENLLCKPRAYFAYKAKIAANDDIAALELMRPDFDGSEALFSAEDAPPALGTFPEGKNSIRFDRSENEEVIITAQTDSKGIFILTDTYYPGWKCYVNGIEKQVFRVNFSMRGVPLDAGRSTLIFRFEPDIFKAGMSISAVSAFLFIAFLFMLKRKKA